MTFSADINKFKEKVDKVSTDIFRGTALDVMTRVIKRTPVDQGTARGNWMATINSPSKELNEKVKDKSGAKAIGLAKRTAEKAKLGNRIYLINNLPYIKPLEDGHSDQRPAGMVKVTVTEFENIVNANARKNK